MSWSASTFSPGLHTCWICRSVGEKETSADLAPVFYFFKNNVAAILASQDAETGRITAQGQPGKKFTRLHLIL
jgi:hypothetical protein